VTTDPHVGREVLVEELDRPLAEVERARLQRLAATGGPHVQRVLALAPDGRAVVYELLAGEPTTLGALSVAHARALEPCWPALAPLGLGPAPDRRVVLTEGGPVIAVAFTGS
jgi:hypothetical protein